MSFKFINFGLMISLITMLLTSCGGDDDSSQGATPSTPTTVTASDYYIKNAVFKVTNSSDILCTSYDPAYGSPSSDDNGVANFGMVVPSGNIICQVAEGATPTMSGIPYQLYFKTKSIGGGNVIASPMTTVLVNDGEFDSANPTLLGFINSAVSAATLTFTKPTFTTADLKSDPVKDTRTGRPLLVVAMALTEALMDTSTGNDPSIKTTSIIEQPAALTYFKQQLEIYDDAINTQKTITRAASKDLYTILANLAANINKATTLAQYHNGSLLKCLDSGLNIISCINLAYNTLSATDTEGSWDQITVVPGTATYTPPTVVKGPEVPDPAVETPTPPLPLPTVASVTPSNNATNVATSTSINFSFNNTIDPTSLTTNTSNTSCSGTVQLSRDGFTSCVQMTAPSSAGENAFLVTPAAFLSEGVAYSLKITNGVKNSNGGNMAAEFNSSFTTSPKPGSTQEKLIAMSKAARAASSDKLKALFNNSPTQLTDNVFKEISSNSPKGNYSQANWESVLTSNRPQDTPSTLTNYFFKNLQFQTTDGCEGDCVVNIVEAIALDLCFWATVHGPDESKYANGFLKPGTYNVTYTPELKQLMASTCDFSRDLEEDDNSTKEYVVSQVNGSSFKFKLTSSSDVMFFNVEDNNNYRVGGYESGGGFRDLLFYDIINKKVSYETSYIEGLRGLKRVFIDNNANTANILANDESTSSKFTIGGNTANKILQLSQTTPVSTSWMDDCINGSTSMVISPHDSCAVTSNQKVTATGPQSVFASLDAIPITPSWNCINENTTLTYDASSVYSQPVMSGQCN